MKNQKENKFEKKFSEKLLILLTVFVLLGLGGCSIANNSESGELADPNSSIGLVESNSDEIMIVMRESPKSLAWHNSGVETISISRNIYEPLVTRDNDGDLSPALAESWEQSDDNTWRFHLRQGVTFHDGTPFDSSVVAWHVNNLFDPNFSGNEIANKFNVEDQLSVEIIDEFTVDIISESPNPIMPRSFYWLLMSSPIANEASPEFWDSVGTGPYKLESFNPGENIILVANPNYWDGEPAIKKVTFIFREDAALRLAMVRAGDADIAQAILPQEEDLVQILTANLPETTFIRMDPNPPFDDIRVRQAICMAIDRESLIDDNFYGFGVPATQLITQDVVGYNSAIPLWPVDQDQARFLVEQAKADGVPVDLVLTIIGRTGIYTNATKDMENLQLSLTEIGLNVVLEMLEKPEWKEINNANPVPVDRRFIIQSSHGNEAGDGIFTMLSYYFSSANKNSFPDLVQDELVLAAVSLTGETRQQALAQIFFYQHDEIVQDCPMIHLQAVWGASDNVKWEPRFDNLVLIKTISLK